MLVRYLKSKGIVAVLLVLASCADTVKDDYVEQTVETLYNKALIEMESENYTQASISFDEVDRQHPYSVWATKAQLMSAYALYQTNKYDEAIISLDRFIQLHPSHRDTPYVYYLKALSYYEQISDVGRDQKMTELAMKMLREVMIRFPKSNYAQDAKFKIDLTRDHLAGKEMAIGRYYEQKRQYLAAINRFKNVTEKYQTTTHVPEALHRLTESYLALGIVDQAKETAAILGHNFPGSEWYVDTYEIIENKKIQRNKKKKTRWYWPFK
jgi:outer membrane protein assembly factor BamD